MLLLEVKSVNECPFCGTWIYLTESQRETLLNIGKQGSTSKLGKKLGAYAFDMLAGHDCIGAAGCYGAAQEIPGKKTPTGKQSLEVIHCPPGYTPEEWNKKMGISPEEKTTCFGAPLQRKPNVYKSHKENSDLIRSMLANGTEEELTDLIIRSINAKLPRSAKYFRIHAIGGDFKSKKYLQAWINVANAMPDITFYTYTHIPPFFIKKNGDGTFTEKELPENMNIVLSGNTVMPQWRPALEEYARIPQEQRKYKIAHVVRSEEEAEMKGLPVDHDDVMAATSKHDFAIMIHGEQMKGSKAGKDAYKARKKQKERAAAGEKAAMFNAMFNS